MWKTCFWGKRKAKAVVISPQDDCIWGNGIEPDADRSVDSCIPLSKEDLSFMPREWKQQCCNV